MLRTVLTLSLGAVLAVGASFALGGCRESTGSSNTAVGLTATTPQVADFAREVGGGRVEVTQILAANADPHGYEPKPSDAESLIDADLVVSSGGDVDAWLDQLIESSGNGAKQLSLIEAVQTRTDDAGDVDPHWWQDPRNAIEAVEAIRAALQEVDPDGASTYDANAKAYVAALGRLDRGIAGCLERVPAAQRKLVTSHDALGYYADRYGVQVIGAAIPSLSTQAQASAGETADLVETIRRSGVSTVFAEAGTSRQLEETIAEEAGARVGGELWADTLGPSGSDGATYIEAEESNTADLVDGFTDGRRSCELDVG